MRRFLAVIVPLAVIGCGAAAGWFYFYGPCGTQRVASSRRELGDVRARFDDALAVATATPLLAIGPQIEKLQAIAREAKSAAVPICAERARGLLVGYFSDGITLMLDSAHERETKVDGALARAKAEQFEAEMHTVSRCAPLCGRD